MAILTWTIRCIENCHRQCSVSAFRLARNFHYESPSNEPGFMLVDKFPGNRLHVVNSNPHKDYHLFTTKTSTILRLQNQEIPNVKTSLVHQQQNTNKLQGNALFSLGTLFASKLQSMNSNNALLHMLNSVSTAGSVFKHRRRKMNKHKFKKRMRLQRLKAPKNQTFKPYIPPDKKRK